jgi:hypothetical protein
MGLVFRRMANEGAMFQMNTFDYLNFKDTLIDYHSTAQGAGILQTIQAMQVASQPGAKQIPYQGVPWFGLTSTLFSIAPLAIGTSLIASFVTYAFLSPFLFTVSVFILVYFIVFAAMYRQRGMHQVVSNGGLLIFSPMVVAAIVAVIAYFGKTTGFAFLKKDPGAGSSSTDKDGAGAQEIGEVTV